MDLTVTMQLVFLSLLSLLPQFLGATLSAQAWCHNTCPGTPDSNVAAIVGECVVACNPCAGGQCKNQKFLVDGNTITQYLYADATDRSVTPGIPQDWTKSAFR